ncbi:hypothetical protein [Flavitalea sp.]|nr:hypothetical protein [Flavitalea sp.]
MKTFFLYIVTLTFVLNLSGQIAPLGKTDYPKVVQPSPEAASLGKYGDVPVSLASGLAQIGIDMYNLRVGDIEVGVNLSYHSGGIRVDEIASSVGLGWNLNAGGVITRAILGTADFVNDATPYPSANFNPGVSFDRADDRQ